MNRSIKRSEFSLTTLRCLINGGVRIKSGGRKNFQNLINGGVEINGGGGGGRKLKKRLKMLIKRWKEQKQVTIYT